MGGNQNFLEIVENLIVNTGFSDKGLSQFAKKALLGFFKTLVKRLFLIGRKGIKHKCRINKKVPQGDLFINFLRSSVYFFAKVSFTNSAGTISSLNGYAPGFSDLTARITFWK